MERKQEIISKIQYTNKRIKDLKLIDLLVLEECIDEELEERGYGRKERCECC